MLAKLKLVTLSVLASLFGFMGAAHAALPTEVETELASAKADIMTLGAIVFGIFVAIALWKWFRRGL